MMKKCPNCTNLMPGDVTRCLRCGFDSPSKMTALVDPAPAPLAKGRWRNGWALARESFRVLRADKQLLLFPLLASFLLTVSALTYQFQGWLAALMSNPRRRRWGVLYWPHPPEAPTWHPRSPAPTRPPEAPTWHPRRSDRVGRGGLEPPTLGLRVPCSTS